MARRVDYKKIPANKSRVKKIKTIGSWVKVRKRLPIIILVILLFATAGYSFLRFSRAETISNTTMGHLVLNGEHDIVYDNVIFDGTGGGDPDVSGVVEIWGNTYNITFRNCTIMPNGDGVGNGIKIVDGGQIHDITFENCHIMTQPRMGFEAIGRGTGAGYHNVNLINNTFEPQGSEAVSYDDDSGYAGDNLVQGNIIKGAGVNDAFSWGQGFEINGTKDMTVIGNTFYSTRGDTWNLQMHTTSDCGWVITDNLVDTSTVFDDRSVSSDGDSNPVIAMGVYGGVFARNVIINHTGWSIAYISASHNMNWATTKWYDARGTSYATPYQTDGSSGNTFDAPSTTRPPNPSVPTATPPTPTPSIAADFNNDGTVNVYDLSILATNWGRSNATKATGDANNDDVVNIYDLSILATDWG